MKIPQKMRGGIKVSKKYFFAIKYKCKDADGGKYLVKAKNALEAWNLFIDAWQRQYEIDNVGYIDPHELERLEVYQICEAGNIIF